MMKRSICLMALAGALSLVVSASASAVDRGDLEEQLQSDAAVLDDLDAHANGGEAIMERIESTFNVTKDQIDALRADHLGFGEIVILLSLAKATPGGVTPDSINQILALRQGPPELGWGQIAARMELKLGKVVSDVDKLDVDKADVDKSKEDSTHGRPATARADSDNGKDDMVSTGSSSGEGRKGSGKK
jgi:hypothetical protein